MRWLGHSSCHCSLYVSVCHPRASRPEILMCFPSRSFASLEDDTMGGENDNGAAVAKDLGHAESGSHSPRAAVGERLGAPVFLFEVFSGGCKHISLRSMSSLLRKHCPSPTIRKERANHGATQSYPSALNDDQWSPLQKILYISAKVCYNKPRKAVAIWQKNKL